MLQGAYCPRQMYGHNHYKKFWLKKMEETEDEQTQDSLRTVQPEGFGSRIFWHSNESFRPSLEIKDRIKSTIRVSSVRSGADSKNCEPNLAASEKDLPDGSEIHRALSIGMQMQMSYDADPRNKPRKSVNIFSLQEAGHREERKLQENGKKSSAKESLQSLRRFLHIGENRMAKTGAMNAEFPDGAVARTCAECKTNRTPLWRNGPDGPKSLCNACGIRFKKIGKREQQKAGSRLPPVSSVRQMTAKRKQQDNDEYDPLPRDAAITAASHPVRKKSTATATAASTGGRHRDRRRSVEESSSNERRLLNNGSVAEEERGETSTASVTMMRRSFAKDEEEGAVLLMALSCGLVNA